MDHFLVARNDVLRHNPPVASNNLTSHGSDWLWTVFALMLLSFLGFVVLTIGHVRSALPPKVHYICIAVSLVATLSYFTMASNLGSTAVAVEFYRGGDRPGPSREIFYSRWVEYFINFSLEFFAVLAVAGSAWTERAFAVFATMFMVVCFLCGTLTHSDYKWGYFVFALIGYLLVCWSVLGGMRTGNAGGVGAGTGGGGGYGRYTRGHHGLAAYLLFLWLLYIICWGLSEAGNVTSVDGECVFYGILDVLSQPVFCLMLLMSVGDRNSGGVGSGTGSRFSFRKNNAVGTNAV